MNVEYRTGDLFDQPDLTALAQGVNCYGVMGSGIAPLFRRRDEAMYRDYRNQCVAGFLRPGDLHVWQHADGSWLYNLASQDRPGPDARLDAIEKSLTAAVAHAEEVDVPAIGMPRIGAGIGGLAWDDVRAVIEKVAATTTVRIVVVTLPGQE